MIRIFAIAAGLCVTFWMAGCGDAGSSGGSTGQEQRAVRDTVPLAPPFDLLAYSALDTNSGVFHGEYDEKVNDEITVSVGLDVTLQNGKITDIKLLDTAWVHPRAAEVIPQRIIDEQKLPVESITGASVSSWSIMTATAVALQIDLTVIEDLENGDSIDSSSRESSNN